MITFALAALSLRLPCGMFATTTTAPLIAALFDSGLPNCFALCWVAFLGTLELRDLRREVPLWGILYNRFNYVLASFAAWVALRVINQGVHADDPLGIAAQIVIRAEEHT